MTGTKTTRLLAAVMFTDIVGYTAVMQEDEERATKQKKRHRKVLLQHTESFDGKVLHYYGDGALTVFNSAYNAVQCAIKIQQDLAAPYLPLRIGIHIGDIAYSDDDVYGDAVNIASRLESLSIAGGILLSKKVIEEIKNHQDISTQEIGTFELKNVAYPVSIYAVTNSGIQVPAAAEIKAKSGDTKDRVAVLPFVNMSNEVGFEYFSDGLTEEIINGLSKLTFLEVISRTSAFAYKGRNEDVRTIGKTLKVSHILEGSVRKYKDKIRITAQLIETDGGFHLWSETFERHLKNIFQIQDEISEEILQKVKRGFEIADSKRSIPSLQTEGSDSEYESYLKGMYELQKCTISATRKAMQYFNDVIVSDSQKVNAHFGLAKCFLFLGIQGQMASRRAYQKAIENINHAQEKEPNRPAVLALKAIAEVLLDQDYDKANNYFSRAFDIDDKCAELRYYYFLFLNIIGQNDEAVQWIEQALKLEPTNILYNAELARAYHNVHRFTDALEQYTYALELESSFLPAIEGKGWTYVAMGELKDAHVEFEAYQNLVSREQKNIPHLIYMASRLNMTDVANHFLEELQLGDVNDSYIPTPIDIALVYLGMGKYDEVFFHLQRAVEDNIGKLYFILSDPVWDEIKSDSRYNKLLEDLNLSSLEMIDFPNSPEIKT